MLYCDIDIHHGDGVEEAFYATDRVMTVGPASMLATTGDARPACSQQGAACPHTMTLPLPPRLLLMCLQVSFHKYGDFFPGTGALGDIGYGAGKHYTGEQVGLPEPPRRQLGMPGVAAPIVCGHVMRGHVLTLRPPLPATALQSTCP